MGAARCSGHHVHKKQPQGNCSKFLIYFISLLSPCCRTLSLNPEAQDLADTNHFQLVGYQFTAEKEDTRASRVIRLGLVQNEIALKDTSENVNAQREALYQRIGIIIEAAALAQVNVLCLQEAWSK